MQRKKNPQADLRKYSSLMLAFGLCLVLLVSWQAIEFKSYERQYDLESLNVEDDDDEEIPITEQIKTPPPPPPPPAPEIIEIVEDEEEIEETIIESTETDQEEIVEEVEVMEEELDLDVPFAIIEDVPLFPGCEKVAKSQRRKCFQEKIQKHIIDNFRYPEIAQEMGIQGRVFVQFMIGKDGRISGIRSRGPDKNLEKEAVRIINKLPKMTPGKQRGRPVRVPFSIPVTFRLN
jgi:protein TonB|tara:strand:- start:6705 stop:7403 length:699 start_codon:yes stop_codon:yes gene_type:complete